MIAAGGRRPRSLPRPAGRGAAVLMAAAGLAAGAVAPSPAAAAVTSVAGDVLRVDAGPGEANAVTIYDRPDGFVLAIDAAGMRAGNGCVPVDRVTALCAAVGLRSASVLLGDGDDLLTARVELAVGVEGGDGADRVTVDIPYNLAGAARVLTGLGGPSAPPSHLRGGEGDDVLTGFFGDDLIEGGPGDDLLAGSGGRNVLAGGPGTDAVTYAEWASPVRADLEGDADDGASGVDRIAGDVEGLVGGSGDDDLRGDGRANRIDGGDGDDLVTGGPGADLLAGGAGDDVLDALDQEVDGVSCGRGTDRTAHDHGDQVHDDCERVTAAAARRTTHRFLK